MKFLVALIISSLLISWAESARILVIFPFGSISHQSVYNVIIKRLLSKGHEFSIITAFPFNYTAPNYKEIIIGKSIKLVDTFSIEHTKKYLGTWNIIDQATKMELPLSELIFDTKYTKELINKEKKVDLIITGVYQTRIFHLLSHALNVPLIIIKPQVMGMSTDNFVGNPYNPSFIPLITNPFSSKMNFFERMQNSIQYAILYWYKSYMNHEALSRIAEKYFNMEVPPDDILNKRTALVMNNNHLSFISRPKSPNAIEIGGIHIESAKKLPKVSDKKFNLEICKIIRTSMNTQDLKEFIEHSPHGVILFSFGTIIKASTIPKDKMKIIKDTFSAIPQRVLWRVDDMSLANGMPSNVKLSKWFPQRDILEHKNVIAFINHGGLQGTYEAIHTATPVIGIPFLYDQFSNVKILVEKQVGICLDYETMNTNKFSSAVKEIVSKKYRENMQWLSQVFKDRPISALDEAVYWTEYIIRYQGAPHMRTSAADMPLYQYLLLDVILFLLISVIGVLYLLKYFLKKIVNILCNIRKRRKID